MRNINRKSKQYNTYQVKLCNLVVNSYIYTTFIKHLGLVHKSNMDILNAIIDFLKSRLDRDILNPLTVVGINDEITVNECPLTDIVLDDSNTVKYSDYIYTTDSIIQFKDNCGKWEFFDELGNGHVFTFKSYTSGEKYPELRAQERAEFEEACNTIYFLLQQIELKAGLLVNGKKYMPFTYSAAGLKEGVSIWLDEEAYNKMACCTEAVSLLGTNAKKYNANKHLQYLSLLKSDSIKVDFLKEDFWNHVCIIDIDSYHYLAESLVDNVSMYNVSKDADMDVEHVELSNFRQCASDGYGIINHPFVYDADNALNNAIIQARLFGTKGAFQVVDLEGILYTMYCQGLNFSTTITDIHGKVWEAKDISIILDKNTFKYYELYKKSGCENFSDFVKSFGLDPFMYACGIFVDEKPSIYETATFTRQFYQFLDLGEDDSLIEVLTAIDRAELQEILDATKDVNSKELLYKIAEYKKGQGEEVFLKALADNGVTNSNVCCSEELIQTLSEAYYARYCEAMLGCKIYAHTLIAAPDLIAYIQVLFNSNIITGVCGIEDSIYCAAYPYDKELASFRSPGVCFDAWVGKNMYTKGNPYNEFLSKAVCYVGLHSTLLKYNGADCDGDHLVLVNNKDIINAVKNTRKNYRFDMLNFFELKEGDIADEELKGFNNTISQTAKAIRLAYDNNLVGKYSAIQSNIAAKVMNSIYNKEADEAISLFESDCCVAAQCIQEAVDSQKRGAFITPSLKNIQYAGAWENSSMPLKQYEMSAGKLVVINKSNEHHTERINVRKSELCDKEHCEETYGELGYNDALYINDDGYEMLMHGNSNFVRVTNYIRKSFPARIGYINRVNLVKDDKGNIEIDKCTVTQVLTNEWKLKVAEHPFDKRCFYNFYKSFKGLWNVNTCEDMNNIFNKYNKYYRDRVSGERVKNENEYLSVKVDSDKRETFFRNIKSMYIDPEFRRVEKVSDINTVYSAMSKINEDAFYDAAYAYALSIIPFSLFCELVREQASEYAAHMW